MIPLIIDIIIVVILIFSVWRGVSKGIILSAIGLAAMVVVFFGSKCIANNYSDKLNGVIGPFITTFVDEKTSEERMESGIEYETADDEELTQSAANVFTRLGCFSVASDSMAKDTVENYRSGDITFKNAVAQRFISALSYIFTFIMAYLLLNIVVAVIINLCNVVFKLPGLKLLNTIGGAVMGLCVGLMVVFAIAWAVQYFGFISSTFMENTKVLKFFAVNNPFNSWLVV